MQIHVHYIRAMDKETARLPRMVPLSVAASEDTVALSVKS